MLLMAKTVLPDELLGIPILELLSICINLVLLLVFLLMLSVRQFVTCIISGGPLHISSNFMHPYLLSTLTISSLIFFKADKQATKSYTTPSPQTPSSQASNTRNYIITNKDLAKLTTSYLRKFKTQAMKMKSSGDSISVTIPTTVYGHEQTTIIDYEDMLDWCFQRQIVF